MKQAILLFQHLRVSQSVKISRSSDDVTIPDLISACHDIEIDGTRCVSTSDLLAVGKGRSSSDLMRDAEEACLVMLVQASKMISCWICFRGRHWVCLSVSGQATMKDRVIGKVCSFLQRHWGNVATVASRSTTKHGKVFSSVEQG
jgi:hypothetical protein